MMGEGRNKRRILSKLVRTGIALLPLAGDKIQNVPIIWPPLGSIETYAAGLATAIIAVFAALPTFFRRKGDAKIGAVVSSLVAVASLIFYANFLLTYVKSVETPQGDTLYRTIGSQRTAVAEQKCPNCSDEQLLEKAGLTDAAIEWAWTPSSVKHARIELFTSYVAGLASINFAIGAFARAKTEPKPK
jgi:hypothetical protein